MAGRAGHVRRPRGCRLGRTGFSLRAGRWLRDVDMCESVAATGALQPAHAVRPVRNAGAILIGASACPGLAAAGRMGVFACGSPRREEGAAGLRGASHAPLGKLARQLHPWPWTGRTSSPSKRCSNPRPARHGDALGSVRRRGVLAACATPHGIQGFLYPFQVSNMEALSMIMEWRGAALPTDFAFFVFAAIVWLFAIRRWRALGIMRWILLVALTYLAIKHARHQALFGILTYIAVLPRVMEWRQRTPSWLPIGVAVLGLLLVVRTVVPWRERMGRAGRAPHWRRSRPRCEPGRSSTATSTAGPLIFHGISPVIDGRADMYGDAHMLWFQRVEQGDLPPSDKPSSVTGSHGPPSCRRLPSRSCWTGSRDGSGFLPIAQRSSTCCNNKLHEPF